MQKLIDPWRERDGYRDYRSPVQSFDMGRIDGASKPGGIPHVPQRAVWYESALTAAPAVRFALSLAPAAPSPRERIRGMIAKTLKEKDHDWTVDDVLGPRCFRDLAHARRDCIIAVKEAYPHMSTPQIGKIFGKDHTTIIYWLNGEVRRNKLQAKARGRIAAGKKARGS